MEAQKSSKYQGSKFAEGRLKLSTACTECHKRKQKVCLQKIADLGNVLRTEKVQPTAAVSELLEKISSASMHISQEIVSDLFHNFSRSHAQ
jgi:hypothetical protein